MSDDMARAPGTPPPLLLGFDTSAAHCAAALVSGTTLIATSFEPMARGQAERLFPMIEEMLARAGLTTRQIGAIAVGTGPGNFTGLRIAVSAARGLALGLGRPALGIPNLEAMAHGQPGPVLACLSAPRGQVFAQRFGAAPMGPQLVGLEALGPEWAAPGLSVVGHDAAAIAARLGATEIAAPDPAVAVARLAAHRLAGAPAGTTWPRPAPLYLRPADAAPSREVQPVILP